MKSIGIYIYGDTEEGFLEIDPSTVLNIEGFTNLFDEELNKGDFSLPITVSITEHNAKLLNFKNKIQNYSKTSFWRCTVYDSGFPEIVNGKLSLLEKNMNFDGTAGNINFTITGTKGLFGAEIRNKKLNQLYAGGVINWQNIDSRTFAKQCMDGTITNYPYLQFVPVAIHNFFDSGRADYNSNNDFLALDTVNNVVILSGNSGWTFGRPSPKNINSPISSGQANYEHYRTVPFFSFKYILNEIFKEAGFKLAGEFWTDARFDDMLLFNNYSIDIYNYANHTDVNRQILPFNHLPDMAIAEFLTNVLQTFNVKMDIISDTNTVLLTYRKSAINSRNAVDVTSFLVNNVISTFTYPDKTGYTLKYKWDQADSMKNDFVKDQTIVGAETYIGDKLLVGTLQNKAALSSFNYTRPLTINDCVFVSSEQLYYSVANATVNPIIWEVYAERLQPFVVGEGSRNVDIPISPMLTNIYFDANNAVNTTNYLAACKQLGSYSNSAGKKVKNKYGLKLFFKVPGRLGLNEPQSANKTADFSFDFYNPNGIMLLHQQWQNLKENVEEVKLQLLADRKLCDKVTNSDYLIVKGVWMLTKKIERQIPQLDNLVVYVQPI